MIMWSLNLAGSSTERSRKKKGTRVLGVSIGHCSEAGEEDTKEFVSDSEIMPQIFFMFNGSLFSETKDVKTITNSKIKFKNS